MPILDYWSEDNMRTVICTVGTSLIRNTRRDTGEVQINRWQIINRLNSVSAEEASAETNSITRLRKKEVIQEGDRLVFLNSATEEGELCSDVLAEYYKKGNFETRTQEIEDLKYDEKLFATHGLKQLVDVLVELIQKYRDDGELSICATGGFKAEIAYATLVGIVFQVPVYYLHEKFHDIVEMPPIPISLDLELVAEYEDLFIKLYDMPEEEEWDLFFKQWSYRKVPPPKEFFSLIVNEGGHVFLSPAGELFYRSYLDTLNSIYDRTIYISSKANDYLTSKDKTQQQSFKKAMLKLLSPKLRRSAEARPKITDARIYPRGNCPERLFFCEEDNKIYVLEISSHEDYSYERQNDKGVWKKDYEDFGEFIRYTISDI